MTPIKISESQFQKEVMQSKIPVLVDFYSETCRPCKTLAGILNEIGARKNGSLKIVKLDVMEAQSTAGTYMIQTLPTTLLFKDGSIIGALEGLRPHKAYEELLESH